MSSIAAGPTRAVPVRSASRIAMAGAAGVLVLLAALHVLSPEFDPSWRMVSEYANGGYAWVLSLMFASWAVSTWAVAVAITPHVRSPMARIGHVLLFVAGIGEAMAAVFDINHALHGAAAFLGILGFPIAAMLTGISLTRLPAWSGARGPILILSNLTWISVVVMGASFALFFSALQGAGVEMSAEVAPLSTLPPGVTALVGWANRFLIVAYCAWTILVAHQAERAAAIQPPM